MPNKIKRSEIEKVTVQEAVKQRAYSNSRMDTFQNQTNGFGLTSDNVKNTYFQKDYRLNQIELEELYDFNYLSKRAIDLPIRWATGKMPEFIKNEDNKNDQSIKDANDLIDIFGVKEKIKQALRESLIHWGAAIFFDYGDDEETELINPNPKQLKRVEVVNSWYCVPTTYYQPYVYGANHPKIGRPEHYQTVLQYPGFQQTLKIHESRLVIIPGVMPSSRRSELNRRGWGFSKYEAMEDILTGAGSGFQALGNVLQEFFYITLQIQDLSEHLLNKRDGELDIVKRAQAAVSKVSSQNVGIYGEGEMLKRESATVSGMDTIAGKLEQYLSMSAGIPHSIYFNNLGGALAGNSADSDVDNFVNDLVSYQNEYISPAWERCLYFLGFDSKAMPYHWPEIVEPSLERKLAARKTQMEIDTGYHADGTRLPEETNEDRFSGEEFDFESYNTNDNLRTQIEKERREYEENGEEEIFEKDVEEKE